MVEWHFKRWRRTCEHHTQATHNKQCIGERFVNNVWNGLSLRRFGLHFWRYKCRPGLSVSRQSSSVPRIISSRREREKTRVEIINIKPIISLKRRATAVWLRGIALKSTNVSIVPSVTEMARRPSIKSACHDRRACSHDIDSEAND